MRLLTLELNNFLAIGHAHLNLVNQGVVLVTGLNKDDDSTRSNGSGKSSIISDGLTYALFGQTMKGLTGADVINRFASDALDVTVTFEDDQGAPWSVNRLRTEKGGKVYLFQGKKDVSLGGARETQEKLNAVIGMDFTTFACSVIFGQGILKAFSAMTDAEQKKVFGRILNLDGIDVWKAAANEAFHQITQDHVRLDMEIANSRKELKQARESKKQLKEERQEWEQRRAEKLEKADQHIIALQARLADEAKDKAFVRKGEADCVALEKQQVKRANAYDKLVEKLDTLTPRIRALGKKYAEAELALASATQTLDDFETVGATCDRCYQRVEHEHTEEKKEELSTAVEVLGVAYANVAQALNKLEVREDALNLKIVQAQAEMEKQLNVMNELLRAVDRTQVRLARYDEIREDFKDATEARDGLSTEKFAAAKTIKSLSASIPEIKTTLTGLKNEFGVVVERSPYVDFWYSAFGNKGLRSFILDSVAPFLTEKANKYSEILTGGNVDIEFQTVTQLKSGDLRDNFKVIAHNNSGAEVYAGASAGEKNKIDLCVGLALQDLVRSRAKTSVNVAVFDEATQNMDLASSERFIELLDSTLVTAETVFVVSHNDVFKGYFSNELQVTKRNGVAQAVWR